MYIYYKTIQENNSFVVHITDKFSSEYQPLAGEQFEIFVLSIMPYALYNSDTKIKSFDFPKLMKFLAYKIEPKAQKYINMHFDFIKSEYKRIMYAN